MPSAVLQMFHGQRQSSTPSDLILTDASSLKRMEYQSGWLAVTSLPRDKWFVIRYLSIRRARLQTTIAKSLLSRAITYVESKGQEFLRATTPAVQAYVEIYQKSGFKPLRRDFRINWQVEDISQTRDPLA